MGLVALGFAPGECVSILSNTDREWLYADLGILGAGGVSNGIYPTDAPAQVEYSVHGLRHALPVRRGRRAARQGRSRCASAAAAAQDRRLRHGGPARFRRRAGHAASTRCARSGREYDARASRPNWEQRVDAAQAGRSGDAGLHLGHDRQAQGRDAVAPQRWSAGCAASTDACAQRRRRRAHVLPAAVPRRRARWSASILRCYTGTRLELRRKPRDGAGERARDRAHRVLRGAAHLGEVLFGRDDRA